MMKAQAANARISNVGLERTFAEGNRACVSAAVTCSRWTATKVDCSSARHKLEHVARSSVETIFANALHLERCGYLEKIQQLGVA